MFFTWPPALPWSENAAKHCFVTVVVLISHLHQRLLSKMQLRFERSFNRTQ